MKKKARVLIIDDEEHARRMMAGLLKEEGHATYTASSGAEALQHISEIQPDLILTDVMMPGMDGFETTRRIKKNPEIKNIPVIVITALEDRKSRIRGLEAGAEEYLTKPVDRLDLKVRVRNLLKLKEFSDFLKNHNQILEQQIQERTKELKSSFIETIYTLMRAAEYRDDETGAHVRRISYYTKALAEALGMNSEFCNTIYYASPMHDIGKIGIPDAVLLKSGGFSPEEWEAMKTHSRLGASILAGGTSPYLKMGREIALSHHERWSGGGYPDGLRGEAIPFPARIMQLADVYDALRSKRPYKEALSHNKAMDIIFKGDDRTKQAHFDPAVLAAFKPIGDTFADIFTSRAEPEEV